MGWERRNQGQMHTARRPPGLSNPSAHRTAMHDESGKKCPSTFWGRADLHDAQSKQKVIETKKKQIRPSKGETKYVLVGHNDHMPLKRTRTRGPPASSRVRSCTSHRLGASSWHLHAKTACCTSRTCAPVGSPNACSRNGGCDRASGRMCCRIYRIGSEWLEETWVGRSSAGWS